MPRIRKKTSKRVTTHQRAKIKHKVAEGRKKNKKKAKKNLQWKSKTKKDPGIPNEFPYKDQILAEVADARRQAEETKRRRKEEKKAAREGLVVQDGAGVEDIPVNGSSSQPQELELPLLLSPDLPNMKAVLAKADAVLHVLDARDPLSYHLPHIVDLVSANPKSRLIFVLNKIDLVPQESLVAWTKHLRSQQATFMFRSASAFLPKNPAAKGKAKETSDDAIGADALLEYLTQQADILQTDTLQVAVVGITNTGKSAIINSLARKSAVPVYAFTTSTDAWSTTTLRAFEVLIEAAGHKINLIDTPGATLQNEHAHDDTLKIRDMLLRCRGRVDKLKDPVPAVAHIVSRADTTDLMVHYNLPAFAAGDTSAFLAAVARSHTLLRKGGVPDSTQAARIVLRDWTTARLPFYAEAEEAGSEGDASTELVVPEAVRTRKEMRNSVGLVRLLPGTIETRRVALEQPFARDAPSEDTGDIEDAEESAGEGEEDNDESGDQDEADQDQDKGASEEDVPTVPLHGKRKRAEAKSKAVPPPKKVTFAPRTRGHQERKQARGTKSTPKVMPKNAKNDTRTKATKSGATDDDVYDFDQYFK